ncbi:MAG TPA: bifunctional oligoribonuclease/PAP phosphatase NrnA [Bacteroidetes bacterium]|nr:bifunctional oligoribonuclease/PAP phosphatase NrnA [Bacteroidota bacterium]HCN37823.1 bifunctional oligoribonuclease/PAP phosphatase NrnA [Bacteroidota bacterium]
MLNKTKELNDIIKDARSIVITTHLIPDGDAIGSVMAFKNYLNQKGKKPEIINHSPTPEYLRFLDKENIIKVFWHHPEEYSEILENADLIFILDTNELSRTKSMEESINKSKAKKICIDHHLGLNESIYDFSISDTVYPATCQMIYDIIKEDDEKYFNPSLAEALYTGIMTDTGSFRYPRTTEYTFLTAADLVKKGADPVYIYEKVNGEQSVNKIKLMSCFLSSLRFFENERICLGVLTQEDFAKNNVDESEIEGFSSILMTIKGVQIGLVIIELKKSLKISFRSKGDIFMNQLAKEFSGGGHKNASGANVELQDIEKFIKVLTEKAKNYLKVN